MRKWLFLLFSVMLFTSCYQQTKPSATDWEDGTSVSDSASYFSTRHYDHDYNFRVKADSLQLAAVPNPMDLSYRQSVDLLTVYDGDRLVVGDIVVLPNDSVDSVWVQVLRDEETIGWVHEHELLEAVVPNNPISLFIDFFSNAHLLIFLAFLVLVVTLYGIRHYFKHNAKLVHFNDISSFYPTMLTLLVSASAVFYSSIQLWAPELWSHFYYHPTLNPFREAPLIAVFLLSVWAIIIVSIATLFDIRKHLSSTEYVLYYLGLLGVCAVDYVIFSISTLYYIGYPLLLAYFVFALWRFYRYARARYQCGHCGRALREKGICPHCGARNV